MSQTEIIKVLRQQPFRPFRMHLSNQVTYDIRHPDLAVVTPAAVYVGVPSPTASDPVPQDVVIVSIRHIVQMEYLAPPSTAPTSPTNGN